MISKSTRIFIRTEASTQIGMGHFMRCFAVAEEARAQDLPVIFLLNEVNEAVLSRCASIGALAIATGGVVASPADIMAMEAQAMTRDDWLLIDSYRATEDYIAAARQISRVCVLDDLFELKHYDCDVIVNPAQSATSLPYNRRSKAKLLLGASYALIRSGFRQPHTPLLDEPSIAVTFGGSDPTGLTQTCIERLREAMPDIAIKAIVGPANVHTFILNRLAQELPKVHVYFAPKSVSEVLAGSDLVITAAGGSVGEIAAMGLPALVLVAYDNQVAALKASPYPVIDARAGLPEDLGQRVKALILDKAKRAKIARDANKLVDGHGPHRVLEALRR